MIGFGFVQDWWVLIPLRLLLGLFEAGYFPGVVVGLPITDSIDHANTSGRALKRMIRRDEL